MTTIVDYGMGNLRNVLRGCEAVGEKAVVTSDAATIAAAEKLILPGVGAFGEAVKRIDALGLRQLLLAHVEAGRPLLGICLGMQLLYGSSEESPGATGLGFLSGSIVRFGRGVKAPHIGWNDVRPTTGSLLSGGMNGSSVMYFVHSYYAPIMPTTVLSATYGVEFSAGVAKGNVFGVQFHPEKSHDAGMRLLTQFASLGRA